MDAPPCFAARSFPSKRLCRASEHLQRLTISRATHGGGRPHAADGLAAEGGLPFILAAGRRTAPRESNRGAAFAAKGPGRGGRAAAGPHGGRASRAEENHSRGRLCHTGRGPSPGGPKAINPIHPDRPAANWNPRKSSAKSWHEPYRHQSRRLQRPSHQSRLLTARAAQPTRNVRCVPCRRISLAGRACEHFSRSPKSPATPWWSAAAWTAIALFHRPR
ncbi:MAG: hypothetical protein JWL69_897 [Phycisphaerales bacterium]|nr:hypothetical protein [Phycisphaerales bacterium]